MRKHLKNIGFLAVMLLGALTANAQRVGVNTENPTRTLHVEGDVQVKGIKSITPGTFSNMLVTDADGNVDHANLWTVNPTRKRVWHLQYAVNNPGIAISANTLKAGRFEFRFLANNTDHGRIQFRLTQNPGRDVKVYFNMEENWGDGNQNDGYEYTAEPTGKLFTAGNWNDWDYPINAQQSRVAIGEMNELYMSYPNENAFYRVLINRVGTGSQSVWIIVAEEYGN